MVSSDVIVRFSKHLRDLRERHGLSQQQLAELADIEYKHVQRLESRRPCDVKLSTLHKLARAFKVPLSKLLTF